MLRQGSHRRTIYWVRCRKVRHSYRRRCSRPLLNYWIWRIVCLLCLYRFAFDCMATTFRWEYGLTMIRETRPSATRRKKIDWSLEKLGSIRYGLIKSASNAIGDLMRSNSRFLQPTLSSRILLSACMLVISMLRSRGVFSWFEERMCCFLVKLYGVPEDPYISIFSLGSTLSRLLPPLDYAYMMVLRPNRTSTRKTISRHMCKRPHLRKSSNRKSKKTVRERPGTRNVKANYRVSASRPNIVGRSCSKLGQGLSVGCYLSTVPRIEAKTERDNVCTWRGIGQMSRSGLIWYVEAKNKRALQDRRGSQTIVLLGSSLFDDTLRRIRWM